MNIQIPHIPFFGFLRKPRPIRSQTIGYLSLVIMVLASSTGPAFGKKLTLAFTPLSLMFISEFFVGFFAMISFGVVPTLRAILKVVKRKQLLPLLVFGVLNGIVGPLLWFTGLDQTAAINADLFGRSEIVLLVFFSFLFLGEKLERAHTIGGSIIALGVATVALRGFTQGIHFQTGDFVILASSLAFASGAIVLKKYLSDLPPQIVMLIRTLCAFAFFALLEPFVHNTISQELFSLDPQLIFALLGFGFIARFLNIFSFYEAIDHLPVATVSMVATLSVVGGMLFTHLYLGSPIFWYQIIGGSFVVLGAIFIKVVGVYKEEQHLVAEMKAQPQ